MYALAMLDHRDDSQELSAAAIQLVNPSRNPGVNPGAVQRGAIDRGQRGKKSWRRHWRPLGSGMCCIANSKLPAEAHDKAKPP